jgi:membrane protein
VDHSRLALHAATWLILTLLFGFYLSQVTSYEATYGALGAVIAFLTWMYLSAYVLVIGAELNSEVEHQTVVDSTTGDPEPIGKRGAWAADEVVADAPPEEQSPRRVRAQPWRCRPARSDAGRADDP